MALSVPVLQASYDAIMFVKDMLDAVEVNKKSVKFLAERLERLLPGIRKLMASNPDDTIFIMAKGLRDCCMDARDFIEQFKGRGKHWMVEKARKAYNRKGDKETIEGILTRIQKFSEDLNLGVTMDIQDSLAKLAQLLRRTHRRCKRCLKGCSVRQRSGATRKSNSTGRSVMHWKRIGGCLLNCRRLQSGVGEVRRIPAMMVAVFTATCRHWTNRIN